MKYLINAHEYTEQDFRQAEVATTEVGYKIIRALRKEPTTLPTLAKKLRIDRNLVSYHLIELNKYGWIDGEWKITKMPTKKEKGKATKVFYVNKDAYERVKQLFTDISEELT